MERDLLNWIENTKSSRPAQSIEHRAFVIDQLKPLMNELENIDVDLLAVSEALRYYANQFQDKAQESILSK